MINFLVSRIPILLAASALLASPPARAQTVRPASPAALPGKLLWLLGSRDDSSADLTAATGAAPLNTVIVPRGGASVAGQALPRGLKASVNPALTVRYTLAAVPQHGVWLSFKLLHAHKAGPQMAVFSNDLPAGLVQLWGTAETSSAYPWKKTYRLYIPKELLRTGENALRLEAKRPLWSGPEWDSRLWWEWDYVQLDALAAPATEPIHGKLTYLGTTVKQTSANFKVDARTVALAKVLLPWMGVAYSGNAVRADFWYDVGWDQPERLKYLQTLRDLNLTVVADHLSSYHSGVEPDGTAPASAKAELKKFFDTYGSLFQFYELENEPTGFLGPKKTGGTHSAILDLARYVNSIKRPHVLTVAPGWAYGDKNGTPPGWEADPAMRRRIEDLCQATNGHSYGFSYADNRGGSFVENLRTYAGVSDGWPKPFVNTETGTGDWHSEQNGGTHLPSRQSHASAFDRILRAHVAVVDYTMQHASLFGDFSLFQKPANWSDLTGVTAYPGVQGQDTRLKTFRRLALAYATHGRPLAYRYLDPAAVSGKMALFRPVDTSALAPLPGSGGRSDKVLLNFVNFEETPQTLRVRVAMPSRGRWGGERIGPGDTYAASHRAVRLDAKPDLELTETLGPGESVQYILRRGEPPAPPARLPAPDLSITEIKWTPARPKPGEAVTLSATIRNTGDMPTPAGVVHGIKFLIDGKAAFWSDRHRDPLPVGGAVTLTANGGANGPTWIAMPGAHTAEAVVDDVDRIVESDEENNKLNVSLTVAGE